MKTAIVSYSAIKKLSSFPGDKSPSVYYRDVFLNPNTVDSRVEAGNALEKAGFHVSHSTLTRQSVRVFCKKGDKKPDVVSVGATPLNEIYANKR